MNLLMRLVENIIHRDIVELLVSLIFAPEKNFLKSNKVTSIYDPHGTGGIYYWKKWINQNLNKTAKVFMCGQNYSQKSLQFVKQICS